MMNTVNGLLSIFIASSFVKVTSDLTVKDSVPGGQNI